MAFSTIFYGTIEGSIRLFDVYNDGNAQNFKHLDYEYMGNDYCEVDVINDSTIELYHFSRNGL